MSSAAARVVDRAYRLLRALDAGGGTLGFKELSISGHLEAKAMQKLRESGMVVTVDGGCGARKYTITERGRKWIRAYRKGETDIIIELLRKSGG